MRRSLSLLVTAGLLPVIALGGTFGAVTLRNERRAVELQAQMDARFAAALLAVKLQSAVRAVEMVAQSPAFDGKPDLASFHMLAARLVRNQPDWHTISVADTSGRQIADVPIAIGGLQQGRVVELASFQQVVATGQPAIGNVVKGPRGLGAFAIRAPVIKAGRVRFVVSAVVAAAKLRELLSFQPLPEGWTASIIDGAGQAVTASRNDVPSAASRAAPIESWAPIPGTAWSVRIMIPARTFSEPIENAAILLSVAALLCLLLVGLLAHMLAAELRQVRRRQATQLQSQRMEALGRLTGGVAHDFNNLLTPILGGLELIGRRATDDRIKRHVEAASASAERAKALVSRLLSFSRLQSLTPTAVDLDRLIEGMADLIDRSLTPSIQLRIDVQRGLRPARADPGQLELAILNLVINARDAMPAGGELRISAGAARPEQIAGLAPVDYVCLEVADTGTGMDEATIKRAADPFFTTKPADKGTGLGLSMVHGFAAQSDGALRFASAPGKGTTVTLVLPCSHDPVPDAKDIAADPDMLRKRILVVDDDEAVRRSTADMLKETGQDVIEATGVDEALSILRQPQPIDAIVTDFLMPNRSGGDLIREVRASWPALPILLVTGHLTAAGELPDDIHTLMKPFSSSELVRALLLTVDR